MSPADNLKTKTARTLKWNSIDRISAQIIYAAVGIVLANELSKQDFGLVGALTVFQAFAIILVDSGFGAALLQKKEPRERDYSTVFWFNLIVSLAIYFILFFCAPLIADLFHDGRLISMSKVMFISFVVNGLGIVQTNRLMKQMHMRPVALANIIGLVVSGGLGIWMAMTGFGAWALVWQTLSLSIVKTGILWLRGDWWPRLVFSRTSLRDIRSVGMSVFSSSILNTTCQQIYSFVIGAFYSLPLLGVYTQADKWSKMGSASISQILTASFVPLLSRVQDVRDDFVRYIRRINRFTSFFLFPVMIGIAVAGEPIFNFLFGNKWDEAIPLFQILMVRGIFVVYISLYSNFLLSKGKARALFLIEFVKDFMIVAAILATVWTLSLEWLVWGQFFASALTWIISVEITRRTLSLSFVKIMADMMPFFLASAAMALSCYTVGLTVETAGARLFTEIAVGILVYLLLLRVRGTAELFDAWRMLRKVVRR